MQHLGLPLLSYLVLYPAQGVCPIRDRAWHRQGTDVPRLLDVALTTAAV